MIVLHVSPLIFTKPNGIINAVLPLVFFENQVSSGNNSALWGIVKDQEGDLGYKIDYFNFLKYPQLDDLPSPYNRPNLVVFHTVYEFQYIQIAKELKSRNINYVVVPHCSLTKEAQQTKFLKKKIGNFLFFDAFLRNALAFRYTSRGEKIASSYMIAKQNFTVENGVVIPKSFLNVSEGKKIENLEGKINITFIGRLDIKQKGLDVMLGALARMTDILKNKNVMVSLYGNDQKGSKKIILDKIDKMGLSNNVHVYSPIFAEEKENILATTTAFIHTSRFEGQPIVVLEVLARGVPCILTVGTNCTEDIDEYGAGWSCKFDEKDIARAISDAINDTGLNIKKENARRLIQEKYQWKNIAAKTLRNYADLLE